MTTESTLEVNASYDRVIIGDILTDPSTKGYEQVYYRTQHYAVAKSRGLTYSTYGGNRVYQPGEIKLYEVREIDNTVYARLAATSMPAGRQWRANVKVMRAKADEHESEWEAMNMQRYRAQVATEQPKRAWRKLPRSPHALWSWEQAEEFVRQAASPWGAAWLRLGRDLQYEIIRSSALGILQTQDRESIPVAAINSLVRQMLVVAKVTPIEEYEA